jgi:hypothetical protein
LKAHPTEGYLPTWCREQVESKGWERHRSPAPASEPGRGCKRPVPIGGEAKRRAPAIAADASRPLQPRRHVSRRGGGRWAERRQRQKTGEDCGLGVFSPSALPPSRLDTCESGRNRHDETAAVAGAFSLPRRQSSGGNRGDSLRYFGSAGRCAAGFRGFKAGRGTLQDRGFHPASTCRPPARLRSKYPSVG